MFPTNPAVLKFSYATFNGKEAFVDPRPSRKIQELRTPRKLTRVVRSYKLRIMFTDMDDGSVPRLHCSGSVDVERLF